jgi:hypothetical protein
VGKKTDFWALVIWQKHMGASEQGGSWSLNPGGQKNKTRETTERNITFLQKIS